MGARAQLWLTAAMVFGLGLAWRLWGPSPEVMTAATVLGLTYLAAFPGTALRLLLLSLSFDQVLTLRAGGSVNVRLAHLCAAILLARLVVGRLGRGGTWRVPVRPLQPLALYFAVAVAGAFASMGLPKTVGYLGWAAFDVVALFAVLLEVCRTEEGFRLVLRWWVLGALVSAGFGLVQLALGLAHLPVPLAEQHLGEFPRINGFNYEPAYFSLYLESVAAVCVGQWVNQRGWRWGLAAAVLLASAALSMSRSGWLGLGLLCGYGMLRLLLRREVRALTRVGAGLGLVASASLLLLPTAFVRQAPRMAAMALDPKEASSTAPRLGLLEQGRRVWRQHPVLGVGLGGYAGYVSAHSELQLPGVFHDPAKVVTTNLWVEMAAETGLLGVGAVLWFLLSLVGSLGRGWWRSTGANAAWCEGLLASVLLVFGVLYHFNQTLWRLDVWVLLAVAWAVVERAARATRPGAPAGA